MSPQHSLIESLAADHRRELRRASTRSCAARPASRPEGARRRAGWFLIGVGLHLIGPGSRAAGRRTTLAGR
jgi:hypothetical protein